MRQRFHNWLWQKKHGSTSIYKDGRLAPLGYLTIARGLYEADSK